MHKHQVRGGSASEALLWRKEQRWEDKKILFCDIFVLLYCHPTDKRGGNLIGSYEMGHWGGEREGDIRIWIGGWGFMARKGKLRRFWNNRIETIMKVSISLASLRGRPYMFTHSRGSDTTHQPDQWIALLNTLPFHPVPPESHLIAQHFTGEGPLARSV